MYLILRVTRTLIAPMLVHASTDPAIFLQSGYPAGGNILGILPAFSTYLVIVTGAMLLVAFLISERRRTKNQLPA